MKRSKKKRNGHHDTAHHVVISAALFLLPLAFWGPGVDEDLLFMFVVFLGIAAFFWWLGNKKSQRENENSN